MQLLSFNRLHFRLNKYKHFKVILIKKELNCTYEFTNEKADEITIFLF